MRNEFAVFKNLNKTTDMLVRECHGYFDYGIAERLSDERTFPTTKDFLQRVGPRITLDEFLETGFRSDALRQEFLAFYLEELKAKVCGQAGCGCERNPEDGIPCEHDMALLNPVLM